ncbi:hypothetical protein AAMO2058_001760500 [Amorphochlora amoebiformis]
MADVKGASSFRAKAEGNLIDSGEKDRIKEILRKKLVDAGWFEKLHAKCQDILKTKGQEKLTIHDLVKEIVPQGKQLVPEELKKEVIQKLEKFLIDADLS